VNGVFHNRMKSRTYWVAVDDIPTSEIDTLGLILPNETIVICVIKLLVRVSIGAFPDLELGAVGILTVRDVQAHVGKDLNGTAFETPILCRAAVTGLEEGEKFSIFDEDLEVKVPGE
jgi:hypothetical protein